MSLFEKNKLPVVSCIVPTKNRPELCWRAVESVLNQTFVDVEVVVIDDSSDPDFFLPSHISDSRIRIIRSNVRLGGAKARNIGIEASLGEFICFLDDDDILLNNKIELMIEFLRNDLSIDVVGADVIMHDLAKGDRIVTTHDFSFESNARHNRIHTNATLIRKSALGKIRFCEKLEKYQDTQFNTELFYRLRSIYLPQPVAVWHVNASYGQITSVKKLFFNTKNYFKLIVYLHKHVNIRYRFLIPHFFTLLSFLLRAK